MNNEQLKMNNPEKTEFQLLQEKWGSPLKYLDKHCPNCGRYRVELFSNGKEVCEKCSTNAVSGNFESEHWDLFN